MSRPADGHAFYVQTHASSRDLQLTRGNPNEIDRNLVRNHEESLSLGGSFGAVGRTGNDAAMETLQPSNWMAENHLFISLVFWSPSQLYQTPYRRQQPLLLTKPSTPSDALGCTLPTADIAVSYQMALLSFSTFTSMVCRYWARVKYECWICSAFRWIIVADNFCEYTCL